MPSKAPLELREWLRQDQQQQDRQWIDSQKRQDTQMEKMATAIRQYGVLIDALRDVIGVSDADWEAAVNRAIDRVQFTQKE
ncbi:hypothetical protein [Sulfobacillus harzensis]|uniref:Uncharacterized protein n=1 Tax=Sulfobacillus harzensis TaxID=2729629 RepID=A0A7Y0L044_9FIRM|nr:hypothetical protein [Sulfobacillus harzensis]NMP20755.1 hypothetical protein [Sulfobacillus harzensis]